ncbi:N(6)-adenine-specific methyltransferase METTL4 [Plodia interpunctella]|uniref:N(6)-adenine-specific methyltransferase METTL4 n=1 Tax=Plodia interpunctella TaxID=58824 RepID=UPI0023686365|nr:N(6)-adenine-specific methyltransferase METTL4 [Plodia interpunctella]
MSLILKTEHFTLLDHRKHTLCLYEKVKSDGHVSNLGLLLRLFSILSQDNKTVRRKRCHEEIKAHDETLLVREQFKRFLLEISFEVKNELTKKYNVLNTHAVRDLAQELHKSTIFAFSGMNGGNNLDVPLKCKIMDNYFLIPSNSRFLCGCVKEQCLKLKGNKYDIVVADPPWWNKYIRRLKGANDKLSYSMMYNEDIASIPVRDLLSPNCLIAMWCTNSPSNISAVKDLIFPSWGVEYVTTWYWLKVTVDLEPVCAFSGGSKKQPYERIILGKVGEVLDLPDSHLVVSVPSALHSHKPPLLDILSQYVKSTHRPQVLELFARYLLPNTTSVGYEPLKWQHISLYEEVT